MPFTPTHALAIIPFRSLSKWFPFSALAIGSMVPDLPLFFPALGYAQTHSLAGIFGYCMPIGLAVFMLFQCVLKVPLFALLPPWFQQRMSGDAQPYLKPSYRFFLGVCTALVIGASTHIVWDAFTHEGRWGTQIVPWLNNGLSIGGRPVRYYKVAQHACTVIGLPLLLALWVRQLLATNPNPSISESLQLSPTQKLIGWSLIVLPPTLLGITKLITEATLQTKVLMAVTDAGGLWMVTTVTYAVLHLWLTKWPKKLAAID